MNKIYLISGPCGCGKTTLSKKLTAKLENAFLISGDRLDDCFYGKDDTKWEDRLRINWDNIISLTKNALQNNRNIVIDYVVEEELQKFIEELADYDFDLRYVVLTASEDTIRARIEKRGDTELVERALFLRNKLMKAEENIPYLYDNSDKKMKQEVEEILNGPRFIYEDRAPKPWVMPTHIVAVAGLIENEKGEVLLIKNFRGEWGWTGGQVEVGEGLIQALYREIMEESGVIARVKDIVGIYSNTSTYPGINGIKEVPTKVIFDFKCEYITGEPQISNESTDIGWFRKEEAMKMVTSPRLRYRFENLMDHRGKIHCYAFKLPLDFIEKTEFNR